MAYTRTPDTIVYHGNCQDGFTGAWIAHKKFGDYPDYVPGFHNKPRASDDMFAGKDVVFIDFTYKKSIMKEIALLAKSVVILDHHKSAVEDLDEFPDFTVGDEASFDVAWEWAEEVGNRVMAGFDIYRSGAMLAWNFFFPSDPSPLIVNYVQDRDLWRFELTGTREISMWLFSFEYTWDNWDNAEIEIADNTLRDHVIFAGTAIERKHQKDIAELLPISTRWMKIEDHIVPVANMPYTMASDAANILATDPTAKFGATYFIDSDGYANFSLRSLGFDVQEIAVRHGGGGHAKAAGFKILPHDMPQLWQT